MRQEDGFTLGEVLASLFILSLLAVSMSAIIQNLLGNWDRTKVRVETADKLAQYLEHIDATEQQVKVSAQNDLFWLTDDGLNLKLATPKIDRTAECVYDLVGRRCR